MGREQRILNSIELRSIHNRVCFCMAKDPGHMIYRGPLPTRKSTYGVAPRLGEPPSRFSSSTAGDLRTHYFPNRIISRSGHLFHYQHLTRPCEITGSECVEIDTTRHRFSHLVFAIPIRSTGTTLIDTSNLMP